MADRDVAARGRVGCIIPAFNAREHIDAALQSIFAQTYRAFEIVVVDDGSSDETGEYLRAAYGERLILIEQTPSGVATARNRGLDQTRSEFVSFLDADDLWPPYRLALLVEALREHDGWSGCFATSRNFWDDPRLEARDMEADNSLSDPTYRNTVTAGLFRRSVFERVGIFDERFRDCSEHEWLIRAKDAGCAFGRIEETLYLRRIHEMNRSRGKKIESEMAQIVVEHMKRVRDKKG